MWILTAHSKLAVVQGAWLKKAKHFQNESCSQVAYIFVA